MAAPPARHAARRGLWAPLQRAQRPPAPTHRSPRRRPAAAAATRLGGSHVACCVACTVRLCRFTHATLCSCAGTHSQSTRRLPPSVRATVYAPGGSVSSSADGAAGAASSSTKRPARATTAADVAANAAAGAAAVTARERATPALRAESTQERGRDWHQQAGGTHLSRPQRARARPGPVASRASRAFSAAVCRSKRREALRPPALACRRRELAAPWRARSPLPRRTMSILSYNGSSIIGAVSPCALLLACARRARRRRGTAAVALTPKPRALPLRLACALIRALVCAQR